MITVSILPGATAFSRNPLPFGMNSNNAFSQTAEPYTLTLYLQGSTTSSNSLSGIISNDETIDIQWAGKAIVITARTSPALNGYQIPTGNGTLLHAQSIKTYLEANKSLATDFTFEAQDTGTDIVLLVTAKRVGIIPFFSFNIAQVIQNWTDERVAIFRPNFKLWWELYAAHRGQEMKPLFSRVDDVDNEGKVMLELNQALHAILSPDRPTCKETNVVVCTKSSCSYYIQYAEFFGDIPELQEIRWTTDRRALRGGLSRTMFSGNAYFSDYLGTKFMTWLDDKRKVRPEMPLFLSYYLQSNVTEVKLKIVTTFSDDTAPTTRYLPVVAVEQFDRLLIPAGFTQLAIGSDVANHPVDNYAITLVRTNNAVISETRTFYVDRTFSLYSRFFLYESSLGGYESLLFTGKVEKSLDLAAQVSEIKLPYNYKQADGEEEEFETNYSQKFEINTGFVFARKDIDALTDFLISPDKLLYDPQLKRLIPIKILSKSIKCWKDGDGLYKLKFEYSYRFSESIFSNDNFNLDPTLGEMGPIGGGGTSDL